MSLQDWTNIATIFGAFGTFMVATVTLLVSLAAHRTQREALPVSAEFGLGARIEVDDDGVRWIWSWMKNTGTRSFVHDVSPHEWQPEDLSVEATPNLARVGMSESLPPGLRSMSTRELRRKPGVFASQYLRTQSYSMFWVSCPPGVEKVKFTAAMSVSRRDPIRFVDSEWIAVPR